MRQTLSAGRLQPIDPIDRRDDRVDELQESSALAAVQWVGFNGRTTTSLFLPCFRQARCSSLGMWV